MHHSIHFLQHRQAAVKHRLHHPEETVDNHGASHKAKHENKAGGGLLTAVQGLIAEITAVGFVSLLLISFQNDITSICGETFNSVQLIALSSTTLLGKEKTKKTRVCQVCQALVSESEQVF